VKNSSLIAPQEIDLFAGLKRPKLSAMEAKIPNLEFINPFILGAVEALQVQAGLKVEGGKPFMKGKQAQPEFVVAGVLGIVSNEFKGSIALYFEKGPFLKIIENMLGETLTEVTDEYADASAELLNITYGSAKTKLNQLGFDLKRALPTVIRGVGISSQVNSSAPAIVIPLRSEFGQVHIEITVDPS